MYNTLHYTQHPLL